MQFPHVHVLATCVHSALCRKPILGHLRGKQPDLADSKGCCPWGQCWLTGAELPKDPPTRPTHPIVSCRQALGPHLLPLPQHGAASKDTDRGSVRTQMCGRWDKDGPHKTRAPDSDLSEDRRWASPSWEQELEPSAGRWPPSFTHSQAGP